MPIDPRELVEMNVAAGTGEVVAGDRPCGRCGYNLKGLPSNGRCPECGYAITRRGRRGAARFSDNLADAPLFYLKTLTTGAWCMAGGSGLVILLILWEWMAIFRIVSVPRNWPMVVAAVFAIAGITWWIGVFICTSQRPLSDNTLNDPLLESVNLRWVNRAMQGAWIISVVALFAGLRLAAQAAKTGTTSGLSEVMLWISLGTAIIGVLGLIPLSIQLSSLADWAGDTGLAGRFRAAAAIIAICGGLAVLSWIATKADWEGFGYAIRILGVWARLGLAIAEVVLIVSLYQLAATASWAISNSLTALDVSVRLAARAGDPLAERSCNKCGYDLSGLTAFDRCPECGHLEESVRRSGLLGLRMAREGAVTAARQATNEEVPLAPERAGKQLKIATPEPIKAGRRPPPPQT